MASFGYIKQAIFDKQARKQQYQDHIRGLNAFDRHKKFLNDYDVYYGKQKSTRETLPVKTDQDTIREGYRFIMSEEDDVHPSWEQRLVKRYYDKLFKEYCIADMSHYKTGKIGLRWRTEKEVISGKGQFVCGNKHCDQKDGLSSYEVNFSYFEAGESKQALVKLVACERDRSESDEDTSIKRGKSKDRRKGDKSSTSDSDHKPDDDENFDEYLSGMFP
ncbi:folate-sensitive fragile site protein [Perilla frutescens var. hirtella]|nr:folate-sensitive fragile site protein [Perilla frutescens var. hirtella]